MEEIQLHANQAGLTLTRGGSPVVILNAGYMGSLLTGVVLLLATRSGRAIRVLAWVLPTVLLATAIALVRPLFGFGFVFTVIAALGFALLARYGATDLVRWVLRGLGVFSVLYALFDIRDDVFLGNGQSDASMLAHATGIPAVAWGILWIGLGIGVLWLLRKRL